MEWLSPGRMVETLHVLAACALVGGQLLVTVAAWRVPPNRGAGDVALARFESMYRRYALIVVLLSAGFGAWLLRYTLVSRDVLFSTPYGPVLVAKAIGTLLFVAYLMVAPPLVSAGDEHGGTGMRRAWAAAGAVLVAVCVGLATSMRYP